MRLKNPTGKPEAVTQEICIVANILVLLSKAVALHICICDISFCEYYHMGRIIMNREHLFCLTQKLFESHRIEI